MADSVYGIVWGSGLLMSMLWIEWPMLTLVLWYGQAYVMDNEHRCILLMAFWMHGPMLQGSVHNSWKLKTSQFLHGQHTHWTCHPLSMFEMLWTGVYDSSWQYPATSHNHRRGVDQHSTGHNQQTDQSMRKRCVALREANGGHTRYWLVIGPTPPPPPHVYIKKS